MTINQLVQMQKAKGEETEFYPTTQEIVDRIAPHIEGSVLDIGCGNGAFFDKLDKAPSMKRSEGFKGKKYGIEKSMILSDQLPSDVVLLGTDFHQQTLIDKKMNFIWCNPPYSEYEEWAEKIILQGNAPKIGMVIPERWQNSDRIRNALFRRNMEAEVLGSYDFMNAERKARAKVQLLLIHGKKACSEYGRYCETVKDPFDTWFEDTFSINAEKAGSYETSARQTEKMNTALVGAENMAETLVELYNNELQEIFQSYKALEQLDPMIFRELKVDIPGLKEALKLRMKNLKSVYWERLFKCYDELTSRLTSFSVGKVTKRLHDNTAIDFTLENIFQLTLWVIKNSNTMYDEQLKHYYSDLIRLENIKRYKSNRHWNDDTWRYTLDRLSKCRWASDRKPIEQSLKGVFLEYRIIVEGYSNFETWISTTRLTESAYTFICDTIKIGKCLGFDIDDSWIPDSVYGTDVRDWSNFDLFLKNGTVFCNMKLYKNGNRHIKFNLDVIKKMNVEAGRLFGWIKSKEDAGEELGLKADEVERMWQKNMQITLEGGSKLLGIA